MHQPINIKHCTTCNLEYENQLLRFCRQDGTTLIAKGSSRSAATVFLPLSAARSDKPLNLKRRQTIAVLPFVNMTGEPKQDLFCDGLSVEITDSLAQAGKFQVASRTSAFAFKNKQINVRDIGKILKVGTILEGSVRKMGKRLRITTQLKDTDSGYHLWSERYEREGGDTFDLQDQVSRTIATLLKGQESDLQQQSDPSLVH